MECFAGLIFNHYFFEVGGQAENRFPVQIHKRQEQKQGLLPVRHGKLQEN